MFRSIHPTIIFLSVWCIASGGCGKSDAPAPASRPAVEVALGPVGYAPLDRTIEVVGTLYGDEEVAISAKVPGRILSVPADVGDRPAELALLAQIDPVDYELEVAKRENALREALSKLGLSELPGDQFDVTKVATVERARLQAANAEAKLQRARKLYEQTPPLLSEQDYADLQTAYQVSRSDYEVAKLEAQSQLATALSRKSELAAAKEQLTNTRIAAPPLKQGRRFAIAQRSISAGEYVREGSPLFRLVLDDRVKFRGSLPERFSGQVAVGQRLSVRVEGIDQPIVGTVSRISPAIDLSTRTFQIEALIDNSDRRLRPGAFARGSVTVGQDQDVPFVPKQAVLSFAGVDKIFGVRDGKAVEYPVILGPERDGQIAIREGLPKEVREIVTTGATRLANQLQVKILSTTPPATKPTTQPAR